MANDIALVKTKIIKVFSTQIEFEVYEDIIYKDLTSDLRLNSNQIAKIIVMIEKLYHTPISDDDGENFNTINDYIQFIEKKHQKKYITRNKNSIV